MSTLEFRRCDYLGCIESVEWEDDGFQNWGTILVQPNIEEEPREALDLCPDHLQAISQMLESSMTGGTTS